MSLSMRQWLKERHIEPSHLQLKSTELSGVAFRLAQEMELKSLTPFELCPLADVLELPQSGTQLYCEPFALLTLALLRLLSRKKPLKRSEGTWLAFQIAYLRGFQELIAQEMVVQRPWLSRGIFLGEPGTDTLPVHPQLQQLIKTLRPGRLRDSQAEQALSLLEDSFLVQQINSLVRMWLKVHGAEETEARLLVQRLVQGLPGHLLNVIGSAPVALSQLQKFFFLGELSQVRSQQERLNEGTLSSRMTIDGIVNPDQERYRASLFQGLSEPLFGEPFSLKEIYVPPKGLPLKETPESHRQEAVDLETWAKEQLEDTRTIAVIEGSSGLGKSTFCQVWSTVVARKYYPDWLPIVISLEDVTLGNTLEHTLASAFPRGRFTDHDGWLSPQCPPCLLILDGLEDLPPSPLRSRSPSALLLDQIIHFQSQNVRGNGRHKIFLTSRQSIFTTLTCKYSRGNPFSPHQKFRRIQIQRFDQVQLKQWFKHWSKVQSKSIATVYFAFLTKQGPFQKRFTNLRMKDLASQPLMLYCLGILHREGLLEPSFFDLPLSQVKFEIYHRLSQWFLGDNHPESRLPSELVREGLAHACRSSEAIAKLLGDRTPEELRTLLQKQAFQLFQGGQLISEVEQQSLPTLFFHLKNPSTGSQKLTFTNPQLGSYWIAVEIAQQLKQIVHQQQDRYGEITFTLESSQTVAHHLYPVLGVKVLSQDLTGLILEHLRQAHHRKEDSFSLDFLFQRLERFYHSYCRGQWMDLGIPQTVYQQLIPQGNPLNVLQIDAIVGLNTFVLLCLIAQAASIPFFPCGHHNRPAGFDADRLLTFIARIGLLSPQSFALQTRHCGRQIQLAGTCLNDAFLAEIDFTEANFSLSELAGANLSRVNFTQANLSGASLVDSNLSDANLAHTNLEGADLSGANLTGVDLTSANLKNACLFQAQLDAKMENIAKTNGAIFSWQQFQERHNTLTAADVTQTWSDQEFEMDETIRIESVEGELFVPEVFKDPFQTTSGKHQGQGRQEEEHGYDDEYDDETLIASNYPGGVGANSPELSHGSIDDLTETLD